MHEAGLPSEFIQRLKLIIPEDRWLEVIASFSQAKRCVFRVNTLVTTMDSLLNQLHHSDFQPSRVNWRNHAIDAIIVPCEQRQALLASKWYQQGLLYSQNLSSQLAPLILDPQPGEEVLDLCAAPGGKTLQMACMMCDRGRIAAVEKVKARFFKLKANLKSQQVTCVQTYLSDGAGVWRKTPERFERVLLDAPCSSESLPTSSSGRSCAAGIKSGTRLLKRDPSQVACERGCPSTAAPLCS